MIPKINTGKKEINSGFYSYNSLYESLKLSGKEELTNTVPIQENQLSIECNNYHER